MRNEHYSLNEMIFDIEDIKTQMCTIIKNNTETHEHVTLKTAEIMIPKILYKPATIQMMFDCKNPKKISRYLTEYILPSTMHSDVINGCLLLIIDLQSFVDLLVGKHIKSISHNVTFGQCILNDSEMFIYRIETVNIII